MTLSDTVTIEKIVLYIIIRAAESDHDREYKTTVLRTVGDAEKSYKNLNSNLFMKGFMENIIRTMDFEFKFPLLPVRSHKKNNQNLNWKCYMQGIYRFINVSFNTSFVWFLLPERRTMFEFKSVGQVAGSSKSQFIESLTYYGGHKRDQWPRHNETFRFKCSKWYLCSHQGLEAAPKVTVSAWRHIYR